MFITLEGIDGSGKTTLLKAIKKHLDTKNIKYTLTREPGAKNSKLAESIRSIILDKDLHISNKTEALLFAASRRVNLEEVIWPAIKNGDIVICDRFVDSSLAYQGIARGIGYEWVKKVNDMILEDSWPNKTFYFDLPPKIASTRTSKRDVKDRIESVGDEFQLKVYNAYKEIINKFPDRFIIIDSTQSNDDVAKQVINELNKLGIK